MVRWSVFEEWNVFFLADAGGGVKGRKRFFRDIVCLFSSSFIGDTEDKGGNAKCQIVVVVSEAVIVVVIE